MGAQYELEGCGRYDLDEDSAGGEAGAPGSEDAGIEGFEQGLKPLSFWRVFGTTEVVPLSKRGW